VPHPASQPGETTFNRARGRAVTRGDFSQRQPLKIPRFDELALLGRESRQRRIECGKQRIFCGFDGEGLAESQPFRKSRERLPLTSGGPMKITGG